MSGQKAIRDSVHGNINIKGLILELMSLPEMQRLHSIRQLGFTYLVYPGANHTRLEHSLGTYYVASRMADAIGLGEEEKKEVAAAAFLHDVGHGPFSHTLEYLMHERGGKDHVEITKEMIAGRRRLEDSGQGDGIKEVLERHGIEAERINSILSGRSGYLSEIIHGSIDADQIDYLLRDAHYTGVAYGVIDFDRLVQTIKVHDGHVVVERKGVSAIESMLVARSLMYSAVYLHKTVRIAELMLIRAVGRAEPFDFSQMVDGELMEYLKDAGSFQRDIALRLKYRKLFKRAYVRAISELKKEEKERLAEIRAREAEDEIADKAGLEEGYVIVDAPGRDILLSEPRLKKMDVKILDSEIRPLSEYTPLANALQMRGVTDWGIMVCCPEEAKERVAKIAEKVLWG
ncbi:MAG: HD domain-containing protein [Thermoplasmata archaeon]|nr:MAG: HD domain-containing protein [Thermoplasmata archaeon]